MRLAVKIAIQFLLCAGLIAGSSLALLVVLQ
jgi:hypothetical protein